MTTTPPPHVVVRPRTLLHDPKLAVLARRVLAHPRGRPIVEAALHLVNALAQADGVTRSEGYHLVEQLASPWPMTASDTLTTSLTREGQQ